MLSNIPTCGIPALYFLVVLKQGPARTAKFRDCFPTVRRTPMCGDQMLSSLWSAPGTRAFCICPLHRAQSHGGVMVLGLAGGYLLSILARVQDARVGKVFFQEMQRVWPAMTQKLNCHYQLACKPVDGSFNQILTDTTCTVGSR